MKYASFGEFYPYYLSEHRCSGTRRLHFAGTLLVLQPDRRLPHVRRHAARPRAILN